MKGEGVCRGIVLTLQNIEIVEDFLSLELGRADVSLRMKWLELLGGMQVNWKNLTMRFQVGGILVILKGNPNLSTSLVSLKTLWKAIRQQGEEFFIELGCIGVLESKIEIEIPSPIQAMLAQFHKVFNVQVGLPPQRSHDHAITLHLGTSLVNAKTYRYPQIQKEKLKFLSKRCCPFSSPMLLVRKKEKG